MIFSIERHTNGRSCIGSLTVILLVFIAQSAHCQSFAFQVKLGAGDTLEFTNISGVDIPLLTFEIVSPGEFLIPIPPGDLRGDPDPFTFLLANDQQEIVYGSLRRSFTMAPGETWSTKVGYDLAGASAADDVLQASWSPESFANGICGLTAGACPEPASGALALFAALPWLVSYRSWQRKRLAVGRVA